ncbi:MAG: TetR/AcrR family transcriptional regulator [Candidatus Coproplasma sp.]
MNRSESKFKHTADKMDGALISLLESKEFSEISIMDICRKANVNRSTFYAHYDNVYDLLRETHRNMINNFLDECNFDSPVDISDKSVTADDLNFVTPEYLLPYLKYVRKHKRLCKIYADNARTFEVENIDNYMIDALFAPIYARYGITDKKLITYMQKFFLKGIDAIVNEWVRNDCEDDILFICEIITFCVRPKSFIDQKR